jgi:hypothetical protein
MKRLTSRLMDQLTLSQTDNQSDLGRDKPFVMKDKDRERNMDIQKDRWSKILLCRLTQPGTCFKLNIFLLILEAADVLFTAFADSTEPFFFKIGGGRTNTFFKLKNFFCQNWCPRATFQHFFGLSVSLQSAGLHLDLWSVKIRSVCSRQVYVSANMQSVKTHRTLKTLRI